MLLLQFIYFCACLGSCLLAAVGLKTVNAEGNVLDIEKEDKIRQFHPIDSLFDYFSSYQLVDGKGLICRYSR